MVSRLTQAIRKDVARMERLRNPGRPAAGPSLNSIPACLAQVSQCRPRPDCWDKCSARRHTRRVFGDMTDTSMMGHLREPSMPWRRKSVMEQRREFVHLAMQEEANVHAGPGEGIRAL